MSEDLEHIRPYVEDELREARERKFNIDHGDAQQRLFDQLDIRVRDVAPNYENVSDDAEYIAAAILMAAAELSAALAELKRGN